MLSLEDKFYWFIRNLWAYTLFWLVLIPFTLWTILKTTRIMFIIDGSETIAWPWEWRWWD